jgi:hypothetical protein
MHQVGKELVLRDSILLACEAGPGDHAAAGHDHTRPWVTTARPSTSCAEAATGLREEDRLVLAVPRSMPAISCSS